MNTKRQKTVNKQKVKGEIIIHSPILPNNFTFYFSLVYLFDLLFYLQLLQHLKKEIFFT